VNGIPASAHIPQRPHANRRKWPSILLEVGNDLFHDCGEIRVELHGIVTVNAGDQVQTFSASSAESVGTFRLRQPAKCVKQRDFDAFWCLEAVRFSDG
jgi:hypothetical protein